MGLGAVAVPEGSRDKERSGGGVESKVGARAGVGDGSRTTGRDMPRLVLSWLVCVQLNDSPEKHTVQVLLGQSC